MLRATADVLIQVAKDETAGKLVGFQVIAARDLQAMESPIALRLTPHETEWRDDDGSQWPPASFRALMIQSRCQDVGSRSGTLKPWCWALLGNLRSRPLRKTAKRFWFEWTSPTLPSNVA